MDYTIAASPVLAVTFAQPAIVRHAWVVSAQGKPCEVPAYDASSDAAPAESAGAPSALYPAAAATPGEPPFAQTQCDDEFVRGTMIGPAAPLSLEVGLSRPPRDGYAAAADIALAPDGRVIDAWIYASSGNAAFDQAVVQSVKQAQYSGSISYCRPVSEIATFTAAYKPR